MRLLLSQKKENVVNAIKKNGFESIPFKQWDIKTDRGHNEEVYNEILRVGKPYVDQILSECEENSDNIKDGYDILDYFISNNKYLDYLVNETECISRFTNIVIEKSVYIRLLETFGLTNEKLRTPSGRIGNLLNLMLFMMSARNINNDSNKLAGVLKFLVESNKHKRHAYISDLEIIDLDSIDIDILVNLNMKGKNINRISQSTKSNFKSLIKNSLTKYNQIPDFYLNINVPSKSKNGKLLVSLINYKTLYELVESNVDIQKTIPDIARSFNVYEVILNTEYPIPSHNKIFSYFDQYLSKINNENEVETWTKTRYIFNGLAEKLRIEYFTTNKKIIDDDGYIHLDKLDSAYKPEEEKNVEEETSEEIDNMEDLKTENQLDKVLEKSISDIITLEEASLLFQRSTQIIELKLLQNDKKIVDMDNKSYVLVDDVMSLNLKELTLVEDEPILESNDFTPLLEYFKILNEYNLDNQDFTVYKKLNDFYNDFINTNNVNLYVINDIDNSKVIETCEVATVNIIDDINKILKLED